MWTERDAVCNAKNEAVSTLALSIITCLSRLKTWCESCKSWRKASHSTVAKPGHSTVTRTQSRRHSMSYTTYDSGKIKTQHSNCQLYTRIHTHRTQHSGKTKIQHSHSHTHTYTRHSTVVRPRHSTTTHTNTHTQDTAQPHTQRHTHKTQHSGTTKAPHSHTHTRTHTTQHSQTYAHTHVVE